MILGEKSCLYCNNKKQMEGYLSDGYPVANGLVGTGLMIRNHRSKKVEEFMNSWWNERNSEDFI